MVPKLKILRVSKGLTQEQLADKVGITSRSIQKYEAEEQFPNVKIAKKISEVLGKSIEYIFFTN